jgi:chromosome partitioning protein
MKEKIYSAKEFAKALGFSKNYLLKLEAEEKVPPARRQRRGKVNHRYYTVEDIIQCRQILGMPPLMEERHIQLFLNFKGGTGKSTISASYAYGIAELGIDVLAIDLDAQQHMTQCLGFETNTETPSIYDVLIEERDINQVIAHTPLATLDIIPSNLKLSVIENRLPNKDCREYLLTDALNKIKCKDYKVIVIDSLPNITMLNKNAILAADDLLVPVLPDFLSFHGLKLLVEELARMEKSFSLYANLRRGRLLDHIYVIINQYRPSLLMSRENKTALEKYYKEYLCKTIIPFNTKLAQSTAAGMPIFQYQRSSPAAKQIRALIDEILKLNETTKKGRRKMEDNP